MAHFLNHLMLIKKTVILTVLCFYFITSYHQINNKIQERFSISKCQDHLLEYPFISTVSRCFGNKTHCIYLSNSHSAVAELVSEDRNCWLPGAADTSCLSNDRADTDTDTAAVLHIPTSTSLATLISHLHKQHILPWRHSNI